MNGKLKAISIELDEEDPAAAREAYLDSVLLEARKVKEVQFKYSFRCDLLGSSHWDGPAFILDVRNDRCSIRMADSSDILKRSPWSKDYIPEPLTRPDADSPQELLVEARELLQDMTGVQLASYLYSFMASDVLGA